MPDEYGLQMLGLLGNAGISPTQLTGICISSVVPPLTDKIEQMCRQYLHQEPLIVGAGIKTGVRIRYDDPRTLGTDRLVNVVAVKKLFGYPACVVDFGTATKFEAIDKNGDYLGGAIAPGVQMSADGLFHRTAKLPRVQLQCPDHVIGRNTIHAMQSGIMFGYVALVEGMVARFRDVLGEEMRVVATGGLAEVISRETSVIENVSPWLTLEGLRLIWAMNQPRQKQSA
jgi:type III pantothenate kinase